MHPVTTVPRPRPDLAGWLLAAARRWHAAEDPEAAVRAVLDDVATLLPPDASVALTLLGTGRRPVAPQGDTGPAAGLDAVQVGRGQGPLLAALAGTPAGSGDLGRDLRWPLLAGAAAAAGVRAATCLPLDTGAEVIGALSVYATGAGPGADRATLVPVAGQVALALHTVRRTTNLVVALDSRDLIGQAKGVLMERYRITADTAFGILVRASQDTHRKVRDVAALVTETGETPRPVSAGGDGRAPGGP
ncbi:ANTAR domain-containing protein [Geodermatophilus saharensis]|uniref:ANTAR domain-containing protein n=1 Tax=Geodermatophilus saharensis TaxID=1137994 RepID=A0A239CLA7_9ACTN|nr:GAF and ANTAR domain-containing protein [Geodermatophilus saharensis]SNS20890.1 ANTAR domain-containing protein [Geodermatophilus saharensis]